MEVDEKGKKREAGVSNLETLQSDLQLPGQQTSEFSKQVNSGDRSIQETGEFSGQVRAADR